MALSRSERNVLFAAFSLLAILLLVLYFDLHQNTTPGFQKIGRTDSAIARVERKYSGQSVWQALETTADVYDYDIIRTEAKSEVNLTVEGLPIHIGENTFVMIHFEKDRVVLKLARGSILVDNRAANRPAFRIEAGKTAPLTTIESRAGLIHVDLARNGEQRVSVLSGLAQVRNQQAEKTLQRGESLNAQGNVETVRDAANVERLIKSSYKSKVTLLSPELDATRLTSGAVGALHFSWASAPSAAGFRLVLALDREFTRQVQAVDSRVSRITLEVPVGKYFWKVISKSADGTTTGESSSRSVSLSHGVQPARAVMPRPGETFTRDEVSGGVLFNWTRDPLSTGDVFQLAKDVEFKSSLRELNVPSNHYVLIDPLDPGTYYWRTRGTVEGMEIPFSKPSQVKIAADPFLADSTIGQPQLLSPRVHEVVDMTEPDSLDFRWGKVLTSERYRLRLFQALRGHQVLVYEMETEKANLSLTDLTKLDRGRFFWRVEAMRSGPRGHLFGKTAIGRFDITLSQEQPIRLKRKEDSNP